MERQRQQPPPHTRRGKGVIQKTKARRAAQPCWMAGWPDVAVHVQRAPPKNEGNRCGKNKDSNARPTADKCCKATTGPKGTGGIEPPTYENTKLSVANQERPPLFPVKDPFGPGRGRGGG